MNTSDLSAFVTFSSLLFSYMNRHNVRRPHDLPLEVQRAFNAEAKEGFSFSFTSKDGAIREIGRFDYFFIDDSSLGDPIAIAGCEELAEMVHGSWPDVICYTRADCEYLLSLNDHDARVVHGLKKRFGGHIAENVLP